MTAEIGSSYITHSEFMDMVGYNRNKISPQTEVSSNGSGSDVVTISTDAVFREMQVLFQEGSPEGFDPFYTFFASHQYKAENETDRNYLSLSNLYLSDHKNLEEYQIAHFNQTKKFKKGLEEIILGGSSLSSVLDKDVDLENDTERSDLISRQKNAAARINSLIKHEKAYLESKAELNEDKLDTESSHRPIIAERIYDSLMRLSDEEKSKVLTYKKKSNGSYEKDSSGKPIGTNLKAIMAAMAKRPEPSEENYQGKLEKYQADVKKFSKAYLSKTHKEIAVAAAKALDADAKKISEYSSKIVKHLKEEKTENEKPLTNHPVKWTLGIAGGARVVSAVRAARAARLAQLGITASRVGLFARAATFLWGGSGIAAGVSSGTFAVGGVLGFLGPQIVGTVAVLGAFYVGKAIYTAAKADKEPDSSKDMLANWCWNIGKYSETFGTRLANSF